ncbi:MAG: YraN family protein [Candidatus Saccharimonadales bacterium]
MTNYSQGHEAEKVAAEYLKNQSYKVLELNWKRPRAEIDIIAQRKHGPMTFFEVKYRETESQGRGLDYITPKKLKQMSFAAELYVAESHYTGEYCLGAIELTGVGFDVMNCIESIS